jgi:hypothetical protein
MMSEQPQPPVYQPGQIVNGHVWTGTEWLPVAVPPAPAGASVWRTLGAVVAFIVAGVAALQGLSWIVGFLQLDSDGNQFAGLLALLGMGALAVGAAFGLAGIFLLKK